MKTFDQHNRRVLDQFGRQAEDYARLVGGVGDTAADPLIAAVRPRADDRVLDVGCGPGHRAVALAPLVAQVTGLDLTPAMLDQARAHQREAGVQNIHWIEGDAREAPFPDGAFTLVLSQATFHHVADPAAILAEMRRVCAPGGRIGVIDLTPAAEKAPAFDAIETLRDPSHTHALTAAELRMMGRDLGLEEIAVQARRTAMPIEPVLAASRPPPGMLERLRLLYAQDAAAGSDALGMSACLKDGAVWATYPTTLIVWRR